MTSRTNGAAAGRWLVPFADGGRDMRDLLGGKGANVAEMTRVLGAGRVPPGYTITTAACVGYMRAGRREPEDWTPRSR
jgi:pyruvate,orthophosphate dikinase